MESFNPRLTANERSLILSNTAKEIESQSEEYAKLIVSEAGTCLKEAKKEVTRAANLLKVSAEECKRMTGEAIPNDNTSQGLKSLSITVREPIGVVCAITPFNRPLNQVVVKLAPAI